MSETEEDQIRKARTSSGATFYYYPEKGGAWLIISNPDGTQTAAWCTWEY